MTEIVHWERHLNVCGAVDGRGVTRHRQYVTCPECLAHDAPSAAKADESKGGPKGARHAALISELMEAANSGDRNKQNKHTSDLMRRAAKALAEAEVEAGRVAGKPDSKAWLIPDFGDRIRSSINARDFRTWFIFTAMSAASAVPARDFIKNFFSKDGGIPGEVKVELRVNGELTNTEEAFDMLQGSFDGIVCGKALRIVGEKLGRVDDTLESVRREMKNMLRREFPDAHDHECY